MTKVEIQFKITRCRGELARAQSRSRSVRNMIEEIETYINNLYKRHEAFLGDRERLLAYASEAEPTEYSNTSIEQEYNKGVRELLMGMRFTRALYAFRTAISKLSKERNTLIHEAERLEREIRNKRREIEILRQQLEQA